MYVEIRNISVHNDILMDMLKYNVIKMVNMLNAHGIILNDDCVKIWIKQYSDDIFYPKIEFDTDRQEIQYDMTVDGDIREIHYKRFTGTKGRSRRIDIARDDLKPALRVIDDIIREGYRFTDYYTRSENDMN